MRRGGALRHPDRSAPRLGLRFAVGIGHLCQIKFWLMQIKCMISPPSSQANNVAVDLGFLAETESSSAEISPPVRGLTSSARQRQCPATSAGKGKLLTTAHLAQSSSPIPCQSTPFARQVAANRSPLLRMRFLGMGSVIAPRTAWRQQLSVGTCPHATTYGANTGTTNRFIKFTEPRPRGCVGQLVMTLARGRHGKSRCVPHDDVGRPRPVVLVGSGRLTGSEGNEIGVSALRS